MTAETLQCYYRIFLEGSRALMFLHRPWSGRAFNLSLIQVRLQQLKAEPNSRGSASWNSRPPHFFSLEEICNFLCSAETLWFQFPRRDQWYVLLKSVLTHTGKKSRTQVDGAWNSQVFEKFIALNEVKDSDSHRFRKCVYSFRHKDSKRQSMSVWFWENTRSSQDTIEVQQIQRFHFPYVVLNWYVLCANSST